MRMDFIVLTFNARNIQEFISKAITLPGEGEIMDMMEVADPDAVHAVRNFIRKELASALKEEFLNTVWISKLVEKCQVFFRLRFLIHFSFGLGSFSGEK